MTELMVIVGVIAVIATVVLARMAQERDTARRISCIGNLYQIKTGFLLWRGDLDGANPFRFLANPTNALPGLSPFSANNPAELWKLLQVAANDLSSQRILVCPSDVARRPADSFLTAGVPGEFAHTNGRLNALSYFLSIDADESNPQMVTAGDRYLTTDPETTRERNTRFLFGQQDLGSESPTAKSVRWISSVHNGGGNASFMAGSSQRLTTEKLRQALKDQNLDANRIWLPNTDATGRGNP
jgi:hypothetical protein